MFMYSRKYGKEKSKGIHAQANLCCYNTTAYTTQHNTTVYTWSAAISCLYQCISNICWLVLIHKHKHRYTTHTHTYLSTPNRIAHTHTTTIVQTTHNRTLWIDIFRRLLLKCLEVLTPASASVGGFSVAKPHFVDDVVCSQFKIHIWKFRFIFIFYQLFIVLQGYYRWQKILISWFTVFFWYVTASCNSLFSFLSIFDSHFRSWCACIELWN